MAIFLDDAAAANAVAAANAFSSWVRHGAPLQVRTSLQDGDGHPSWEYITAVEEVPQAVREELVDAHVKRGTCSDYAASNGLHYRW